MTQTNGSTKSRRLTATQEELPKSMVQEDESAPPRRNGRKTAPRPDLKLIEAEAEHSEDPTGSTELDVLNHPARVMPVNDDDIETYADELKRVFAQLGKGHAVGRAAQRVVIAGVTGGFDASRIAWGLALTSVSSGFRVLLVDANLNRPAAHTQFGISNDFGLSDLLMGSESPHRFPQSTSIPNLAVIAAGPKLSIYAGLLARERLFHRLEPLAPYFDYIITDAGTLSPTLLARVSEGADNVIVTARQHASSMHELASVVRTLRDVSAPEPSVLMIE
jgi:Mrp family chromosome partitioning ATPase